MNRIHGFVIALGVACTARAHAQLVDITQAPNAAQAGIKKSLAQQIGPGRGDVHTPGSSLYLIARDPFRAIRRGRQLFQRKFTEAQGVGPRTDDGVGDIQTKLAIGAGLADSCAGCHGRPFGSGGAGGSVSTRPVGRDAPHLFGLGLKEMLADEITRELRRERERAVALAAELQAPIELPLASKGIDFGFLRAHPDGRVDAAGVEGVDADLRVRPFFAHGGTISIREFIAGAFKAEMGLESADPDLLAAAAGADVATPAGMLLSGSLDAIEAPPLVHSEDDGDLDGIANEIDTAVVDLMEFYLLNYFKPATGRVLPKTIAGREHFLAIGCADCHVPDLPLESDRRFADVETHWDPTQANGVFNELFATAATQIAETDDGSGHPPLKSALGAATVVRDIFTDFKRHDLGPAFAEMEYDATLTRLHMTTPLWGVGSTPPYGHDGRSADLRAVILRHGGEARSARMAFEALAESEQEELVDFLRLELVLFSPEDTASNLNPIDPEHPEYPAQGHGSLSLAALFNDPGDPE